jgi:hypothetical protein
VWANKASCTCLFIKLNLSWPLRHPPAVSSVFYYTSTFDFYFRSCVIDKLETGVSFLDHTWTHRPHRKSMYSPPPPFKESLKIFKPLSCECGEYIKLLIAFQYISNKIQRYTIYLYLETALHVSGGTSTHHQERIQLYLQRLVFVTLLLLSAAIMEELEPV